MNTHFPCITKSFNHFRLSCNIIVVLFYITTIQLHLPVRGILNSIRRIKVDALHLPLHALAVQQGVHHQEAVALDEAVLPVVAVLVVACQPFQFILLVV